MRGARLQDSQRAFTIAGAVLAAAAVAAGAFGAHLLRNRLAPGDLDIYETAARYQMYHALALILTGVLPAHRAFQMVRAAGGLFLIGILLFSGSLYALAFSGQRWLGAITPAGGVAFLTGWACFALAAIRERSPAEPSP